MIAICAQVESATPRSGTLAHESVGSAHGTSNRAAVAAQLVARFTLDRAKREPGQTLLAHASSAAG